MSIDTVQDQINNANVIQESKADIVNLLSKEFASSVNRIYINSLGKEYDFREITVKEQKTLSRIMIDNENKNRKDVIFDAQCALINQAALDKTFDIYQLREFDRLKLLIALYQANMFKNDVKFTCEECGTENMFKLDFQTVLAKLDEIEIVDKPFSYENQQWKYEFVVSYPTVKRLLDFNKTFSMRHRHVRKNEQKSIDAASNMDYINQYIKTLTLTNKYTNTIKSIDFNSYPAGDIEDIIAVFPQDVLYSEKGIIQFIIKEFIKKINDTFEVHTCYNCGTKFEGDVTGADSFL